MNEGRRKLSEVSEENLERMVFWKPREASAAEVDRGEQQELGQDLGRVWPEA